MTDPTIFVANKSTQVSDADVAKMCAACTKQLATHVAPMFNLGPVPVTFLPKGAAIPPAPARIITIMDVLDDAQALGYHTEQAGGHIWGAVGTAEAMKQGAKALTGAYAISSILSHEVVELFADARINLWADNGRGLTIAYELCDPCENDFYLIDGVAVSSFVGPAWFDHLAEKTARFDYLGHLSKPFTMTHGGYWVQAKAGAVTQKFGDRFPEWRKAAKQAQFSRAQRRVARSSETEAEDGYSSFAKRVRASLVNPPP